MRPFSFSGTDTPTCLWIQYTCELGYPKCIYQRWVCDGEADCQDGDDERNCEENSKLVLQCAPHVHVEISISVCEMNLST